MVEAIVEGPGVVLNSEGRRRWDVATARCSAKVWPHGWDLDSEKTGVSNDVNMDVNMDIVEVSLHHYMQSRSCFFSGFAHVVDFFLARPEYRIDWLSFHGLLVTRVRSTLHTKQKGCETLTKCYFSIHVLFIPTYSYQQQACLNVHAMTFGPIVSPSTATTGCDPLAFDATLGPSWCCIGVDWLFMVCIASWFLN